MNLIFRQKGKNMKAVLVDDEYYALQGLRMELEEHKDMEVVGLFTSPKDFLEQLDALAPDIIFLDIEMPMINGINCAERILEMQSVPRIVFVTAYDQYAIRAFEINALDYLLKPVVPDRLNKTLERFRMKPVAKSTQELQFNCFKRFLIQDKGVEKDINWRTKKAEELIAFLICEEGAYVTKEKIAEALWPDLDQQRGLSNLYLTHYYIKKMTQENGLQVPIESKRGRMRILINPKDCDVFQFNDWIKRGKLSSKEEKQGYFEKAFSLYKGMIFEDRYYPWVTVCQQIYEREYLELVQELMRLHEEKGEHCKVEFYKSRLIEMQA